MKNFTQSIPNSKTTFDLIFVEGSTFWMGSQETGPTEIYFDIYGFGDEQPAHEVHIPDFFIGKFLVTQALWKAVMGEKPSFFHHDSRPVEQVSWDDAKVFIKKLNDLTGKKYRLPTEAEWEFAAHGGTKSEGYKYSGSDKLKEVGWFDDNSHGETKLVGLLDANELGIFDMSGNVCEWCEDDWDSNYNDAPKDGSAWIEDPERGVGRAIRGGGWGGDARNCRASWRGSRHPDDRWSTIGFRLSLSLQSIAWPILAFH